VSDVGEPSPPDTRPAGEPDHILRAKYLDFCSAQVADILLRLSPDEMYVLAQDAARDSGFSEDVAWDRIVSLATARVSRKLGLPSLEEWVEAYRREPSRYDPYLLGLWHEATEVSSEG
jgi:hypothetical protein